MLMVLQTCMAKKATIESLIELVEEMKQAKLITILQKMGSYENC